jgi:NAD(P)-dependent dehydrogenase (short-subunit alcohol dehydrogenase family)
MTTIDLSGKRAVITGAAGGLGRGFATALCEAGAQVMVADIDGKGAAETADQLTRGGARASSCEVDVSDATSCKRLADAVQEALGGVDVLVNNAAIYGGLTRAPFEELDEREWDRVMAVNVKGVWQVSRALSPFMRAGASGSIINIASATVFSGSPHWMHYVASKGAVIAMTRVMAKELGGDNIRVNVIAPGFTLTDASCDLIENAKDYGASQAALMRNGDLADIAGGVLYLASDLSRYTSGQTLVIDGGKKFI